MSNINNVIEFKNLISKYKTILIYIYSNKICNHQLDFNNFKIKLCNLNIDNDNKFIDELEINSYPCLRLYYKGEYIKEFFISTNIDYINEFCEHYISHENITYLK